jgi:hypothetical protein
VKLYCKLNERVSNINQHFIVGHSYFMNPRLQGETQDAALKEIWDFSILPLLSEYRPDRSLDELREEYGLEALETLLGSI